MRCDEARSHYFAPLWSRLQFGRFCFCAHRQVAVLDGLTRARTVRDKAKVVPCPELSRMSLSPVSRSALWLAAPLAFAFGSPTLHAREEEDLQPAAIVGDVPTPLPVNARPRHYALSTNPAAAQLTLRRKTRTAQARTNP